jgi:hypothetical protein
VIIAQRRDIEFGKPDRVWLHSLLNVAASWSTVMARMKRKGGRKGKRK